MTKAQFKKKKIKYQILTEIQMKAENLKIKAHSKY